MMGTLAIGIICFIAGGALGTVVTALMAVASEADDALEEVEEFLKKTGDDLEEIAMMLEDDE